METPCLRPPPQPSTSSCEPMNQSSDNSVAFKGGYGEMAADQVSEREADEWSEALIADAFQQGPKCAGSGAELR